MSFCSLTPFCVSVNEGKRNVWESVCEGGNVWCHINVWGCVPGGVGVVVVQACAKVCAAVLLSLTHTFSPVFVTWDFIHTHRLLLLGFPTPSAGGSPHGSSASHIASKFSSTNVSLLSVLRWCHILSLMMISFRLSYLTDKLSNVAIYHWPGDLSEYDLSWSCKLGMVVIHLAAVISQKSHLNLFSFFFFLAILWKSSKCKTWH